MTPEALIRNSICSWLSAKRALCFVHDSVGIYDPVRKCFRANNCRYRIKGVSDILGIWQGKFLAIEVKVKGKYATPEQKRFIEWVTEHGGIAFVARSIDDVKAVLEPHEPAAQGV